VNEEIADAIEEARAFTDRMRADVAASCAELAKEQAERAGAEDEMSKARRSGAQGFAWQRLQERIDMRRTTLADILNGIDLSDEARAVRADLAHNLVQARRMFVASANDPQVAEQFATAQAAQQELAAMVRRLGHARGAMG